jgi:uncharacterized coiled-coil DUF342 family protein
MDHALLDFYQARALQELAQGGDDAGASAVIQAYRKAVTALAPQGGQRALEAQDGLAQAIVSSESARLEKQGRGKGKISEHRLAELREAIEKHQWLVEFRWYNSSTKDFAAALENLASDYEVLSDAFALRPLEGMHIDPLREAETALDRAAQAYQLAGETERASDAIKRLEELRQRLHS